METALFHHAEDYRFFTSFVRFSFLFKWNESNLNWHFNFDQKRTMY